MSGNLMLLTVGGILQMNMRERARLPGGTAPIVVDLDGTLSDRNLGWEMYGIADFTDKLRWLMNCMLRGRAYASSILAAKYCDKIDLYLRESLVDKLRVESTRRPIILATGAPHCLARRVSGELDFISMTISSGSRVSCISKEKVTRIKRDLFGNAEFCKKHRIKTNDFLYIGDSEDDPAVWSAAQWQIVVCQEHNAHLIAEWMDKFPRMLIMDYRMER